MNAASPHEIGVNLVTFAALIVISYVSGSLAFIVSVPHIFGAEIPDSLIAVFAAATLTAATLGFSTVITASGPAKSLALPNGRASCARASARRKSVSTLVN